MQQVEGELAAAVEAKEEESNRVGAEAESKAMSELGAVVAEAKEEKMEEDPNGKGEEEVGVDLRER